LGVSKVVEAVEKCSSKFHICQLGVSALKALQKQLRERAHTLQPGNLSFLANDPRNRG